MRQTKRRRESTLRCRGVALVIFLALALPAGGLAADGFRISAEAQGTASFTFFGQKATADLRADITLEGTLIIGDVSTTFTAEGRAVGSQATRGARHAAWWVSVSGIAGDEAECLDTPPADAWIAFEATGRDASGRPIVLSGGVSIAADDEASRSVAIPSGASVSGSGSGRFYLLCVTSAETHLFEGTAAGAGAGTAVSAEEDADVTGLQIVGSVSLMCEGVRLVGRTPQGDSLPDWPSELLAQLVRVRIEADAE